MVSPRRFGAFVVASVIAIALIPLQQMPVSAASNATKATSPDELAPLPTDKHAKRELTVPTGDFSNPPPK